MEPLRSLHDLLDPGRAVGEVLKHASYRMIVREIHGIQEVEPVLQGRLLEAAQKLCSKSLAAPLGSYHHRNFGGRALRMAFVAGDGNTSAILASSDQRQPTFVVDLGEVVDLLVREVRSCGKETMQQSLAIGSPDRFGNLARVGWQDGANPDRSPIAQFERPCKIFGITRREPLIRR